MNCWQLVHCVIVAVVHPKVYNENGSVDMPVMPIICQQTNKQLVLVQIALKLSGGAEAMKPTLQSSTSPTDVSTSDGCVLQKRTQYL